MLIVNWKAEGTGPAMRVRKTRLLSGFRDIPEIILPENQVIKDPAEIPAPLPDEIGDSWLDAPVVPLTPGQPQSQDSFDESHIDLTPHALVNLFSMVLILNASEPTTQDENSIHEEGSTILSSTVVGAADISWD